MRYVLKVTAASFLILATLTVTKFFNSHRFAPRQSGLQGLAANGPVDVLFIGSSHTRQSYDLRRFERQTGFKAFVLAYNGLDYVAMVPMLQQILQDPKLKPRVCVVEAYSANFARAHEEQDSRLFFDADPQLKKVLLRKYFQQPLQLQHLQDAFVLVVNRNNDSLLMYPLSRALLANLSYHGAYENKNLPGLSPEAFRRLEFPLSVDAAVSPDQREALRTIAQMGRASGVEMVFIESPLPAPVAALVQIRNLKSQLKKAIEMEELGYFDGDTEFPVAQPALFADNNHLSTEGRALFTDHVVEWLRSTRVIEH